jgi:hypothetical protein
MDTPTHTNHDNTINFMYFISNYPQGFIKTIFSGYMANHLESKFLGFCNRYGRSDLAFLSWFYELDGTNQRKLLEWVNANYKAFRD